MAYNSNAIGFLRPQPTVTADGEKLPVLIQEFNIRTINRRNLEIKNWRDALKQAESTIPRRTNLYDIYFEVLLDAHLTSIVEKRINAITNVEWEFVDQSGKAVDDFQEWIKSHHFEKCLREIINTKFWGYTMLEFDFYKTGGPGVFLIPRKHMRPESGYVSREQTGNQNIPIRTGPFANTVVEVGDEKDLGLLLQASQYVIYKRGGLSDWADFSETFGQPIIDAVWDGYDENQRKALEEALGNIGAGGRITRPAGTEVQILQGGTNNPTGDLYKFLVSLCNAELSKLILGQTETTESSDSSGYAQSQTHSQTENDINRADLRFVERVLNTRVLEIFEINGWNTKSGHFRAKDSYEDSIGLNEQIQIDVRLKNEVGIPMADDYFYDKYDIDKPENYDELKREMEEQAAMNAFPNIGLNYEPDDDKSFLKRLRDFFKAPTVGADINIRLNELYQPVCCTPIQLADKFTGISESLLRRIFEGQLRNGELDPSYYERVARLLNEVVLSKYSQVDFDERHQANLSHLQHNIFAFSAAKNFAQLEAFRNALTDEKGELRNYGAFRQRVTEVDKVFNDNYLRTEYNSAIRSTEMADKHEYLQRFDYWEYRTVGDNRVRPAHEKLHGKVFAKDDPIWNTIYPPNDWGCRCTVIPATGRKPNDFTDIEGGLEGVVKPYFRKNLAKERVVFTEDHPYFEHSRKKGIRLSELDAVANYGMRNPEQIYRGVKHPSFTPMDVREKAAQWFEKHKNKTLNGAGGAKVILDEAFEKKIIKQGKPKYAGRFQYAHLAKDTIENADEVWSQIKMGRVQNNYVKYFEDAPYVFVTAEEQGKMKFKTFYKVDKKDAVVGLRKGMLKHRK